MFFFLTIAVWVLLSIYLCPVFKHTSGRDIVIDIAAKKKWHKIGIELQWETYGHWRSIPIAHFKLTSLLTYLDSFPTLPRGDLSFSIIQILLLFSLSISFPSTDQWSLFTCLYAFYWWNIPIDHWSICCLFLGLLSLLARITDKFVCFRSSVFIVTFSLLSHTHNCLLNTIIEGEEY